MPVYSLTSPESGRTYQVNIDREPTPEDVDSIWPQLDAHVAQQEANKPFFALGDTLSGIGTALGGLPETATASYYRLTEGMKRPDQYSPEARAAFDAEQKFTQQVQQESQNRLMRGEASSAGESFRDAAPSLGFSGVTMGANILGRVVGRPAGAVVGGLVSAPTGPGALGGAGIGGAIGETATGMAASGYAAYRMAGNQFLDQAFQRIGEERAKRGEPWGEQEKEQAYNELLPLAQDTGLWEAGPEAVGNAVGLAAGKYVLGLGKKAATDLAETIWKKAGKKVAALAGGTLTELGTETITQVGSAPAQAQAEALAQGNPNWKQEQGPYAGPGGTLQALADVAPATLAQSALMLGAGGAVKAGQTLIDQRQKQRVGQPMSEAPAAEQPQAASDLEEDAGALTAADIQDLEPQPMQPSGPQRQPILTGVPDRIGRMRENSLNEEPIMEGDVITDLRVPRSPEAIAESQRIENDRAAKEAEMRMLDAKARGMPLVTDSPTGSRDIVDWANENPIYLPPGFSEERKLPEYEALGRNPLPPYWRQFVASSKQGGNPDSIAQRAFDAGLIAEPTADAYMQALQEGIAGRQQYRVQFAQRDKALAQEEKRVIDFEKSQTKLAKRKATQQVPFEDIVPGDAMTIDGEQAVVRNVEYNEDGYLTNVVIEDGKRFGLMQFDPQTRGGLLVDEFKPASREAPSADPFAPAATQDQPQTITGPDVQTGTAMPVPPPTADAGAGAGEVTRPRTTATPPATAARTAPAASDVGGRSVASGGEGGALLEVAPSTRPRNRGETSKPQRENVLGELTQAMQQGEAERAQMGFTNLYTSGRTAGFLNTEILSEAEALVRRGVTSFVQWSQAMVQRFGEAIREFLGSIWQQVTSPQTNAAQNVRLGMPQGNAPVSIGAGGFVQGPNGGQMEGPNETQARWASPIDNENVINGPRSDEQVLAEARAWLAGRSQEQALSALENGSAALPGDARQRALGLLINQLALQVGAGGVAQQIVNDVLLDRAGRLWHSEQFSADLGREFRQRSVVGQADLLPVAPVLAAKQVLVDRGNAVMGTRFQGGAGGAVSKIKKTSTAAGAQAGEELAAQLDADADAPELGDDRGTKGSPKDSPQKREARNKINQAQRTAQSILDELARRYSDPPLFDEGQRKVNAMRELYKERVKTGMPEAEFVQRAMALGANAGTAGILWEASKLEMAAREMMALEKSREGLHAFLKKDSPELAKLLNSLRLKIAPGMTWAEIFTDMPERQKDRQREIYRRLMLDERLKALNQGERLILTNELDRAWQRERRKVFQQELKKAGLLGEKDTVTRQKVVNGLPKLLRLMNLGVLTADTFREALAPEFNLRAMTGADVARLRDTFNAAYKAPKGIERNRLLHRGLSDMQKITGSTKIDLLNNAWVASVLSGSQTLFDTATTLASGGLLDTMTSAIGVALQGKPEVAITAVAEFWRSLPQLLREAGRILGKGELWYLRQFADEAKHGLEGLGIGSAITGERLLSEKEISKKALGLLLAYTGRTMAAFDHLTNNATKAGALPIARALNPELYQGPLVPSDLDKANARAQAKLEMPTGTPTEINRRAREILENGTNPKVIEEAEQMGDIAAFQNDPTGFYGGLYEMLKSLFGRGERILTDSAEKLKADSWARASMLVMAGSLRAALGAKFIRFAMNWANKQAMLVPGTYLIQKAGLPIFGSQISRTQANYILGRNVVGLAMMASFYAFMRGIMDKDDEEEGWHLTGGLEGVSAERIAALRSAGVEKLTLWKRNSQGRVVQQVNYKNMPFAALLAALASTSDERKYQPEKHAQRSMAGHMGRALAIGAMQFKDISAVEGLGDLFQKPKAGSSSEVAEDFAERLAKSAARFMTGFIPNALRDVDSWTDSRYFKPETAAAEWVKGVPFLRRTVNDGRPMMNLLGEEVNITRAPWNRQVKDVATSEAGRVLGGLLSRGLSVPGADGDGVVVVRDGQKVLLSSLGTKAVYAYQKAVGERYREWLGSDEGRALLTMPPAEAARVIEMRARAIKRMAGIEAVGD